MKRHQNIVLLGTSHVAPASVKAVQEYILNHKPNVVAVELDQRRLVALLQPTQKKTGSLVQAIKRIGVKGVLFGKLGAWAEKRIGKMTGSPPGSEMKAAVQAAERVGAKLALIDQDIHSTLQRLTSAMTWRERGRVLKEILLDASFSRKALRLNIQNVPSEKILTSLIERVKREYPSIYKVLIQERNTYMAKKLLAIQRMYPKQSIVAIVGIGHEQGVIDLLKQEGKNKK